MSEVTPGDERDEEREALIDALVMSPVSDYIFGDMTPIERSADAILAAGFRRISPVTREAIAAVLVGIGIKPHDPAYYKLIDALSPLSVSPPAEEWEWGVLFPEIHTKASFIGSEDAARYFMGRPAEAVEKYATDTDKRILVRRVKAGPWVPVTPGEGKEQ